MDDVRTHDYKIKKVESEIVNLDLSKYSKSEAFIVEKKLQQQVEKTDRLEKQLFEIQSILIGVDKKMDTLLNNSK